MSTTSTKPQIFINNVDQTISEETISKACEEICNNKPSSITLRPSHDKKNNLCVITLSNQTEGWEIIFYVDYEDVFTGFSICFCNILYL